MNDTDYIQAEMLRHNREITAIENLPAEDRKEGQVNLETMLHTNLDMWLHHVELLLEGAYGAGALLTFERLSTRSNRKAWLFNTIAQLEYRTSNFYARTVWNNLHAELQNKINNELETMITNKEEN